MHPLIADKTLVFSPALAASIGLEEAIVLTWLNDVATAMGGIQWHINNDQVRQALPFWDDQKIRLVLRKLHEKGLLRLISPLFPEAPQLIYCFANHTEQSNRPSHVRQVAIKEPMQQQWQPSADTITRLKHNSVPEEFSFAQLDAFMIKSQEQGVNRNDWNTQFFRFVRNQWVYEQANASKQQQRLAYTAGLETQSPDRQERFQIKREEAGPISQQWQPSLDAQQILQRAGINAQFIQDSIPEFVLYWQERGDAHKTWNTKFIQHVRQQWARYSSSLEHSSVPTRISDDWQPVNDCYDILTMAHIDVTFAKNLIAEFVLYWRDSNQLQTSWNSKFLQYVKQQWARQLNQGSHTGGQAHAGSQSGTQSHSQPGYATAAASRQRLSDTDW